MKFHVALAFLPLLICQSSRAQTHAYVIDSSLDQLFDVDLSNGVVTSLASTANNGLGSPASLAWRASTQEMWTMDIAGGEAGTVDLTTGRFTPLAQTGLSSWDGMAWDETSQRFYCNNPVFGLYTLDPRTGVTTFVGPTGFLLIASLEFDPSGTLWGLEDSTGDIVRIDPNTGSGTATARTVRGFEALTITRGGIWYGLRTLIGNELHVIDPITGATSIVGSLVNVLRPRAIEITDSPCSGTIRRTGLGCLDGSGTPLRMESSGFPCIGWNLDLTARTSNGLSYYLAVGLSNRSWNSLFLPLDLTPFGAPGCSVYGSQELLVGPLPFGSPLTLTFPMTPFYVGATFHAQGWVFDPVLSHPLPIATSDLLTVTLGS